MNRRIQKILSRGTVFAWILFLCACATENTSPVPVTGDPIERVTNIDGFLFYEKQPLDRIYDVLGYVEVEQPSGQKRERALVNLRTKAQAMGGNAIINLQHVVVPQATPISVLGGTSARDFGQYGGADLTETFRWRGTVVRLKP